LTLVSAEIAQVCQAPEDFVHEVL